MQPHHCRDREQGLPLLPVFPFCQWVESWITFQTSPAPYPENFYADIHPQMAYALLPAKWSCSGCCNRHSLSQRTRSFLQLLLLSSSKQIDPGYQQTKQRRRDSKSHLPFFSLEGSPRACNCTCPGHSR